MYTYLLLFFLTLNCINAESGFCQKADSSWSSLLGTGTNYDNVRGHGNLTVEGCIPHKIWSFIRHGIRQQSADAFHHVKRYLPDQKANILESHKAGKGTLCNEEVEELIRWRIDNLTEFEDFFLTGHGKQQAYELGEGMRNHFPNLLGRNYDPTLFYFGSSNFQRSLATLRGFVEGLFSNDDSFISSYIGEFDQVADYDCIPLTLLPYATNKEGLPVSQDYAEKTKLFETIAENLSQRTGLHRQHFNRSIIPVLYDTCIFETARDNRLSPWCNLFGKEDAQRMLLREEIYYYSSFGTGGLYRDKFGCTQMKSLFSFFNDAVENVTNEYLLQAYFGHESAIQEILSRMQCFKSELTDDYFNSDFNFNISHITPFGANLVAVLYKCEDTDEVHKLRFYLNETPLKCCLTEEDTEVCSWIKFRERMRHFVLNCKEDFCDKSETSNSASTYFLTIHFYFVMFSIFFII